MTSPFPAMDFAQVRAALLARDEIALLDVREEHPFAQAHPLWAANLPFARIELDAWRRIPRRDTTLVVYDDGEGLAEPSALKLLQLGYTQVSLLKDGLAGWRVAGGELFRDVNVPSKSFGEWVEAERHTPSLSAQEVKALIDGGEDLVVLDARRFDEYQTMSIPTGISVPGAELVRRARELAPDPTTRVVVNCAGRTRSIIGTQSLVNAGLPNPVSALRNGTIGWLLAGQALEHGQARRFPADATKHLADAQRAARKVANAAGVQRVPLNRIDTLEAPGRTLYRFDVRTPEEFAAGHLPGFASAPGGQLVQETDHSVPVRGARIVLADDDGVRASMSASWLAQMGWEVFVVEDASPEDFSATEDTVVKPPSSETQRVSPKQLAQWLAEGGGTVVLDFAPSAQHVKAHIPGAWWALRSQLGDALEALPPHRRLVLTCGTSALAAYVASDSALQHIDADVWVLDGGNTAWTAAGRPSEAGDTCLASPRIDRYRRPYEGTDAPREAMQAYLDWEFGLNDQLRRDGTHHFSVVSAEEIDHAE
jgi:rhodanese-related sulfurtransferase